jgi:sodium/proline symporter
VLPFGLAYMTVHPEQTAILKDNNERIFIGLAQLLFNPWIVGVVLSAILAAVMSTLSCQLLVCSSAITEDFYKGFIRPTATQKELVWMGRFMVLLVSAIAIVIAQNPDSKVLGLVSYAWAGFGAAFGPVVLMSLFWRRMTGTGALAGMLVGALTVIAWKPLTGSSLYEIVPGFILGMIAIYVVSLLTPASDKVMARFDEAATAFKNAR